MANFSDLIGAYLQNAAAPSGQNRMGNVLQTLEKAGPGGAGVPGAAAGGLLGGVLDAMQKGLAGAARNPAQAGGMGAILGGLLGGGGGSVKGALGRGADVSSPRSRCLRRRDPQPRGSGAGLCRVIARHRGRYGRGAQLPATACPTHWPATRIGAAYPSGHGVGGLICIQRRGTFGNKNEKPKGPVTESESRAGHRTGVTHFRFRCPLNLSAAVSATPAGYSRPRFPPA